MGTVSYGGSLCGLPGAPTVYSRVSASLGFINGM
jgi:secreted trypsin-like serine protease